MNARGRLGAGALVLACVLPLSAARSAEPERVPFAGGKYPFSAAVRAGDTVYVSGQIGIDAQGKLPAAFDDQARLAMDHVAAILQGMKLSMDDVVKCTVMIGDMAKWEDFNRVYRSYFAAGKLPARSAFGANGLALGAQVEVECIAWAPQAPRP